MCRKIRKTTGWFCISGSTHMGHKCLKKNYALTSSSLCRELKLQWFSWNRIYCCDENWQNITVILLKLLAIRRAHIQLDTRHNLRFQNEPVAGCVYMSLFWEYSLLMCSGTSLYSFEGILRNRRGGNFAGLYCNTIQAGFRHWKINCLFSVWQVNMVIGILVFNKLVSRDGILDKKLKHRAG